MVDLDAITVSLTEIEPGLWKARESERVSYPAGTHKVLAELEDDSFWFSHRALVVGSILDRYPPSGCLFDVGGGNGYMVRAFKSRGLDAILVEPGEDGARAAIDRGLEPVVNATLATAGFHDESMAAVGLFDVLEHIEDDVGFLTELHRKIEPSGRLYLTVPSYRWLWSREDERAGHYRRYTSRSLRRALHQASFEIDFLSYFFVLLPFPIFLARTVSSFLRLRDSTMPNAGEHRGRSRFLRRIADGLLRREARFISRRRAPFGSSLIAVARRQAE